MTHQLLVVTGRSGSGKSSALNVLEDSGFRCLDNFPVSLLESLYQSNPSANTSRFAISVDVRAGETDILRLPQVLEHLQQRGINSEILFLDADTATLMRRFSETRRRHPLTDNQTDLRQALQRESELLHTLAELADISIDTSQLAPATLSDQIARQFHLIPGDELQLVVQSFGFKKGVPIDADFLFDVRILPNPFWLPELRGQAGNDQAVIDFLAGQPEVEQMIESISQFIGQWLPGFRNGSRSYLTIAIGCTGGQHRSVYVSEQVTRRLNKLHSQVLVRHRDLRAQETQVK